MQRSLAKVEIADGEWRWCVRPQLTWTVSRYVESKHQSNGSGAEETEDCTEA